MTIKARATRELGEEGGLEVWTSGQDQFEGMLDGRVGPVLLLLLPPPPLLLTVSAGVRATAGPLHLRH